MDSSHGGQLWRTVVSVDLDPVACYAQIHGLRTAKDQENPGVLRQCLPRFLELFAELDVQATFFVVGWDLARERSQHGAGAEVLRDALRNGHELANHSYSHAYDLVRWSSGDQREDLRRCDDELRALGADPVGFRAPGYTHDRQLLHAAQQLGYHYDSSVLPSPTYYGAKVSMIVWHALRGRRSASLLGGGRGFFASGRPHRLRGMDLWELPISAVGPLALPMVGTFALAGPTWVRRRLLAAAATLPYLHLELHGIDLADPVHDELPGELCRWQPELKVPLALRRERLRELLRVRGPTTRLRDLVGDLSR